MHVHGIPKSSDREHTWIACIIHKIPQKRLEWLGQVYISYNTFFMSNILCQSQNQAKINKITPKIITTQVSIESSTCI